MRNVSVSPNRVLVIAEEVSQRSYLKRMLITSGFEPGEASKHADALIRLRMIDYDAVLLHLSDSQMDSIEFCGQLRSFNPRLPVLIVSACDRLDHKVEALEAGADDYMVSPVAMRELSARLRSTIRRSRIPALPAAKRITVRDIVLDPALHRVEKSGREVQLTPLAFRALQILMEQAGKPVAYEALLISLWGPEQTPYRERLRALVGGLRKKLEDDPSHPIYLHTLPQLGYRFQA